ncbi:MAG: toprim domain-containing protein [Candidatus Obscuribacterales bacterium]|nr:toprim domain-containing protein [Candidatus Obscuribacterales bacterium]
MNTKENAPRRTGRPSIEQIKSYSRGQAKSILERLGINGELLSGKHGPCPNCGGTDRFRFDDKDGEGTFYCNKCGAGDLFKLLQLCKQWTFPEALNAVAELFGYGNESNLPISTKHVALVPPASTPEPDPSKQRKLEEVWSESIEVKEGDPVWLYHRKRGLCIREIPDDIRFHTSLPFYGDGKYVGNYPAMVAKVSNPDGSIATLHRTYLTPDGQKAFGPKSRKLMSPAMPGALRGSAIRLFPVADTLGIAEGIETAIACTLATGIPTWAAISSTLLPQVMPPRTVHRIIIFADRDESGAGQKAGKLAAERFVKEGFKVKLIPAPNEGEDWLDVYIKDQANG